MRYVTSATIDLDALGANLRGIRERARGKAILAPVKANAYGHGAVLVSQFLEQHRLVEAFGVASVSEGIELRDVGIKLPIVKFSHCFPEELSAAVASDLTLSVVDESSINAAQVAARKANRRVGVQLAVDTGMRRVGCEPKCALSLAQLVAASPNLVLEGVFTHLPVSDTLSGVEFTHKQLAVFATLTASINESRAKSGLDPVKYVHASNSGAVLGHSLDEFTMLRPGLMMYGYYPDLETPRTIALQQVMTWSTKVSFIKRIEAGDSVGYGRTWIAPSARYIATIPVGYADGFSRLNSNQGRVLINGRSFPIAGRICMDQSMVDLGEDDSGVKVGDEVVLLGRSGDEFISTDELAQLMGTITYEVTCLIGPRVPRIGKISEKVDYSAK